MRRGPKAPLDPAALVAWLDAHSVHRTDGFPVRMRKFINGVHVDETDARMIRRWRAGQIKGVTAKSADALLKRYNLTRPEEVK